LISSGSTRAPLIAITVPARPSRAKFPIALML